MGFSSDFPALGHAERAKVLIATHTCGMLKGRRGCGNATLCSVQLHVHKYRSVLRCLDREDETLEADTEEVPGEDMEVRESLGNNNIYIYTFWRGSWGYFLCCLLKYPLMKVQYNVKSVY